MRCHYQYIKQKTTINAVPDILTLLTGWDYNELWKKERFISKKWIENIEILTKQRTKLATYHICFTYHSFYNRKTSTYILTYNHLFRVRKHTMLYYLWYNRQLKEHELSKVGFQM